MARPKKTDGEIKDQRVPIVMSPSELKELDDWMHKKRIRSRGEAIRRLCQIAFIADASPKMMLAMAVLAHYVKGPLADTMKSGETLETDVKRLCFQVIEDASSENIFTGEEGMEESIEAARRLAADFAIAKIGTPLEKKK